MKFFSYLLICLCLFFLFGLPSHSIDKMRSPIISYSSIPFKWSLGFRNFLLYPSSVFSKTETSQYEPNPHLLLENQNLRTQINAVYEWLLFDQRIQEQSEKIQLLSEKNEIEGDLYWREFFQRRSEELKDLIDKQMQALPAKVFYREPSTWSSSLWIDVGEKDNEALGKQVVAKNSPVLVGTNLIGVIEFVDQSQSRVRLITDSGLVPSVRVLRGKTQDKEISDIIKTLLIRLQARNDLINESQLKLLRELKEKLSCSNQDFYLAKGELQGTSDPLWRCRSLSLKGIGFNYNYSDEEGPSRDLRTGAVFDRSSDSIAEVLIKPGDLLVTSGMDGIFPPGLNVAVVDKVDELSDGDYCYNIEAIPTTSNLIDLNLVFVLPPLMEN